MAANIWPGRRPTSSSPEGGASAMPLPLPTPDETPGASRIVITKVFVRGLTVEAQIGVYKHEKGRAQTLVVDVELDVAVTNWNDLSETVNYEIIAAKARQVAAEGHRGL